MIIDRTRENHCADHCGVRADVFCLLATFDLPGTSFTPRVTWKWYGARIECGSFVSPRTTGIMDWRDRIWRRLTERTRR
jgi:hypothetical protein